MWAHLCPASLVGFDSSPGPYTLAGFNSGPGPYTRAGRVKSKNDRKKLLVGKSSQYLPDAMLDVQLGFLCVVWKGVVHADPASG